MNRVWGELLHWLRYTTTSSLAHATLHWWLSSHLLYSFFSSAFYSIGFPLDFFFFSRVSFINAHISHSKEYFVPKLFWPRCCSWRPFPFFFSFSHSLKHNFLKVFSFSILDRVFNGFEGAKAKIRPGQMLCARDDATLGRGLEPSKVDRHSDTVAPTQNDVQPLVLEP